MIVSTIESAIVLVPNKEHKNFTESKETIPASTTLVGTFKKITGLRRGKPFDYRVFVTDENKIIYADKVTPQPKEIKSPSDSANVSAGKKIATSPLLYASIGAALGYYIANRQSKEFTKKTMIYVVGGAVVGYYLSKTIQPKPITPKN